MYEPSYKDDFADVLMLNAEAAVIRKADISRYAGCLEDAEGDENIQKLATVIVCGTERD
jgi:hypothetical protein